MGNFKQRLIVGIFSTITAFSAIYFSNLPALQVPFVLFIAAIVSAALWEFYAIGRQIGHQPLSSTAIGCSIFYVCALYLALIHPPLSYLPAMVLWISLIAPFAYFLLSGSRPYTNIAITLFGIAYVTIPLGLLLYINYYPSLPLQDGRFWLFYLLIVTKITDIGAYFTGKLLGNKKLAPFTSPSKTYEGAIGGLLAAIIASFCYCSIMKSYIPNALFSLTLPQSLWFGAILSCFAQFSDLTESLLKRDGNIKDSNHLPGLGGILDIVDSVIFTAPLVYLYLSVQASTS